MDTVHRYFAAMYASRAVPAYLKECRVIVDKMTGNLYLPDPNPPLVLVTDHLDTLQDREQAAHNGPKGSAADRNVALLVVQGDMRMLRSYVQVRADSDITHAQTIIESAGMYVSTRARKAKPDLAVRYGAQGGAELSCRAFRGKGVYQWQMSGNLETWTDLEPTTEASTTVAGLPPATLCYFRFRTFTKAGYSEWSTPIRFIAH